MIRRSHLLLGAGVAGVLAFAWSGKLNRRPEGPAQCKSYLDQQLDYYASSPMDGLPPGEPLARRTAVSDIILPADPFQYKELNKMALLGVKVIGRDRGDFPLGDVFFVPKVGGKAALQILPKIISKVPTTLLPPFRLPDASPWTKRYGPYYEELLVMVPVRFLQMEGELGVKMRNRSDALLFTQLPLQLKDPFILADKEPQENPRAALNDALVMSLVEKYYCRKI